MTALRLRSSGVWLDMKTLTALTVFLFCTTALADKGHVDALGAYVAKTRATKKIKTFTGKLEDPKVGIFQIKKGRCYVLALRLGQGATLDQSAVEMDWPDDANQQQPVGFGASMTDPAGAVFQPDCATMNASVGVWVGVQNFEGIQPHGKGPYTIEVFERTASKRELSAEASARAKAHQDSIKERDESRAKTCRQCSTPISDRKVCVERRGLTMDDCGW